MIGTFTPAARGALHEVVVERVIEEQLRDQEVHAGGDLLGQVFQILLGADGVDVRLREARGADRKRVVGGDQLDQFA